MEIRRQIRQHLLEILVGLFLTLVEAAVDVANPPCGVEACGLLIPGADFDPPVRLIKLAKLFS